MSYECCIQETVLCMHADLSSCVLIMVAKIVPALVVSTAGV